jgi:hypothetical protein
MSGLVPYHSGMAMVRRVGDGYFVLQPPVAAVRSIGGLTPKSGPRHNSFTQEGELGRVRRWASSVRHLRRGGGSVLLQNLHNDGVWDIFPTPQG